MNDYRHCNHHHELTGDHEVVDFGDGAFVANKAAVPLLRALKKLGLRTRTHHVGDDHAFIGILLDNATTEVRPVNEVHADRTKYNGKTELLITWTRHTTPTRATIPTQGATRCVTRSDVLNATT